MSRRKYHFKNICRTHEDFKELGQPTKKRGCPSRPMRLQAAHWGSPMHTYHLKAQTRNNGIIFSSPQNGKGKKMVAGRRVLLPPTLAAFVSAPAANSRTPPSAFPPLVFYSKCADRAGTASPSGGTDYAGGSARRPVRVWMMMDAQCMDHLDWVRSRKAANRL
jgi:hypothetical protein